MALLIEAKITGPPEGTEKLAMLWIVTKRNEEITQENERLPEGGRPTPLLLMSTGAELKNSTEIVMHDDIRREFARYQAIAVSDDTFGAVTKLRDIRERWANASDAQKAAALAALPA